MDLYSIISQILALLQLFTSAGYTHLCLRLWDYFVQLAYMNTREFSFSSAQSDTRQLIFPRLFWTCWLTFFSKINSFSMPNGHWLFVYFARLVPCCENTKHQSLNCIVNSKLSVIFYCNSWGMHFTWNIDEALSCSTCIRDGSRGAWCFASVGPYMIVCVCHLSKQDKLLENPTLYLCIRGKSTLNLYKRVSFISRIAQFMP